MMLHRVQYCRGKLSVRPSVCPSLMLRYCGCVVWVMLTTIKHRLGFSLSVTPNVIIYCKGNIPKLQVEDEFSEHKTCNNSELGQDTMRVTVE